MNISQQIEAVYRRALLLRQYALEKPVPQGLLDKAIQELYFVLEELQASQEELHQQNQALTASQQTADWERQRSQTLFDLAPTGYLVTDLKGMIRQVNHHAATLLLCAPADYSIGKPLLVFIDEPDRPRFQAHLANLSPGQPWEFTLRPRNGAVMSVAIAVTQIIDPQHERTLLLWSLHDITLRKQLEQQLQTSHAQLERGVAERTAELTQTNTCLQQEIAQRQQADQKLRDQAALIDIATDAIIVLDLDQRIVFWSKGAERVYGWAATDILEKNVSVLAAQDSSAQLAIAIAHTLDQGSWHTELAHVTQSGTPISVASHWTVVRNSTGQPQSLLIVNTDITEKKQLELQVYRAQRVESLGSLLSGIVHDLNTVLTPILGYAQLQLRLPQDLDEKTHAIWQIINRNAQQGADLVQQILLFARGTSGERIPLQADAIVLDVVKIIQQTFPKSIAIRIDSPTQALWWVAADPTQLYQVVINLCMNAHDAMPEGGTLTLSLENCVIDAIAAPLNSAARVGRYVRITVADTGIGIPAHLVEQIFEPFFTTKAPGQGTGLGLSTVFNIVKNYDGFIEVLSELGKGTHCQVYLPAIEENESWTNDAEPSQDIVE